MFATVADVKSLTGFDVPLSTVVIANGLVETYIGRSFEEVDDGSDLDKLARAVAYQAAYLKDNGETVFQQIDFSTVMQNANQVTTRGKLSLYYHPLSVVAMNSVSWRRTRAIKAGTVFGKKVRG